MHDIAERYTIRVQHDRFIKIEDKSKTKDGRIFNRFYPKLLPGQLLKFVRISSDVSKGRHIICRLVRLKHYSRFREMLQEAYQIFCQGFSDIDEGVRMYHSFKTHKSTYEELATQCGVCAMHIIHEHTQSADLHTQFRRRRSDRG